MDDHGDYRNTGRDCQHERSFFERTKRVSMSARSLGEDHDRVASADSLRSDVIGTECGFSVLALDLDHAHHPHPAAKDRNFEQFSLGHELVAWEHSGE